MTNWALLLEYDGSGVAGWQRQTGQITQQSILEDAAARLNGGLPVSSVAAGRTDAGVHANAQVAMLTLPDRYDAERVRDALNYHMRPAKLVVVLAARAKPDWHPRFSAIGRAYAYRILTRRARPVLQLGHVWHVDHPLDLAAMSEAAKALMGRHDFTSFRAMACQAKSPVRTLDRLEIEDRGDEVVIRAAAQSFLHHQVRNMVGTLKLVGEGRWSPARVGAALAARDRSAAGPTAPPQGLTLTSVTYETDPFS